MPIAAIILQCPTGEKGEECEELSRVTPSEAESEAEVLIEAGIHPHYIYAFRVAAVNAFGASRSVSASSAVCATPAGVVESLAPDETDEWTPVPRPMRNGPGLKYRRQTLETKGANWTLMKICDANGSNRLTNWSRANLSTTDNRTEQA